MKLRKEDMPVALELPAAKFRMTECGDISAAFVELKAGVDASPLLEGLPDDKCQCAHWGYMLTGAIHVTYTDGTEEVCKAGELFYWPSGHTVRVEEDTTFVEFSPQKDLKDLYEHLGKKIAAA